jgi:hypothetical protein
VKSGHRDDACGWACTGGGAGAGDEAGAEVKSGHRADAWSWACTGGGAGAGDEAGVEDKGGPRADAWSWACTGGGAGTGDGSYTKALKISETFLKVARSMPSAPPMWA